MDAAIVRCYLPPRTQVLQVLLRPFSLGHLLTLHKIGSPYIVGGEVTVLDLFASVHICTLTWEECQEFTVESHEWAESFRGWIKKVGNVDFAQKSKLFEEYLREGLRVPDYSYEEQDGQQTAEIWTPPVHRVRLRLLKETTLTDEEVMNRPLILNWLDYLTLEEMAGACKVLTDEAIAIENAKWAEHERVMQSLSA